MKQFTKNAQPLLVAGLEQTFLRCSLVVNKYFLTCFDRLQVCRDDKYVIAESNKLCIAQLSQVAICKSSDQVILNILMIPFYRISMNPDHDKEGILSYAS